MSDRFTYIGSSYLFLIKDEKILLQRRFQTGFEDGNYGVPAGHLDGNETAREGCAREIKEEIGINIDPATLAIAHRPNPNKVLVHGTKNRRLCSQTGRQSDTLHTT